MSTEKLAILVGGGPAPGINSVIGAATIRAILQGVEVLGIRDGFQEIMHGNVEGVRPLTIADVSRIHFRGGSVLGTSRANPTTDEKYLENAVVALRGLGVTQLITIGGDDTTFSALVDTLAGAIIKRRAERRFDGVAVLAEGLADSLSEQERGKLGAVEYDEHGHLRLSEIDIGDGLKRATARRLEALRVETTIVSKNIGYELRCADPIPFDMEYTRDLGYCAAKYLFSGGHAAMVSLRGGHFVPVPFAQMLDAGTGRTRVRMVDLHSTRYAIARRYMIRLRRDDFEDAAAVARFAAVAHLTPDDFRRQFAYLVENEAPPLDLLHRDGSPS